MSKKTSPSKVAQEAGAAVPSPIETNVDTGTTKRVVKVSMEAPQVFEYEPTELLPDPEQEKKKSFAESPERKAWFADVMGVMMGIRSPVTVLEEVSLECVAQGIRDGKFTKIMTMAGAGISTSAGIPDYRSPGVGMFDQLKEKYPNIRDVTDLFNIQYFVRDPAPFFQRSKPFFQISLKPTPCHYFIRLLHEKGVLLRHYTQNIDTLERVAGLPSDKVVEAHGSYYTSHCQDCEKPYPFHWLEEQVLTNLIPICEEEDCSGVVKPDIVLFGESLGSDFGEKADEDTIKCDLLIVMGTALAVQPFASLTSKVKTSTPRVYINMDRGKTSKKHPMSDIMFGASFDFDLETNYRDIFKEGKCDEAVYEMADLIGWGEELRELVAKEHARIDEQDRKKGKLQSTPITEFFSEVHFAEATGCNSGEVTDAETSPSKKPSSKSPPPPGAKNGGGAKSAGSPAVLANKKGGAATTASAVVSKQSADKIAEKTAASGSRKTGDVGPGGSSSSSSVSSKTGRTANSDGSTAPSAKTGQSGTPPSNSKTTTAGGGAANKDKGSNGGAAASGGGGGGGKEEGGKSGKGSGGGGGAGGSISSSGQPTPKPTPSSSGQSSPKPITPRSSNTSTGSAAGGKASNGRVAPGKGRAKGSAAAGSAKGAGSSPRIKTNPGNASGRPPSSPTKK